MRGIRTQNFSADSHLFHVCSTVQINNKSEKQQKLTTSLYNSTKPTSLSYNTKTTSFYNSTNKQQQICKTVQINNKSMR